MGGLNGTIFKYSEDFVPVELISFKGRIQGNAVQLEWKTATEINNYGYVIERNIDGKGWNRIGFVKGQGSTSGIQNYSYTDNNISNGSSYKYRLKQIDFDGSYSYSIEVEIEYSPENFVLYQNYPNPFNPTTTISWELPVGGQVTLKVFDILGNEVVTLVNEYRPAGKYNTKFDAAAFNYDFSSGVYIYQIKVGNFTSIKKMLLLK